MWGRFGRTAHYEGVRRQRRARLAVGAGTLAVALLAGLNPLVASATEPTATEPATTEQSPAA
ncbi:MAG: hypothetical protein M3R57_08630, partial [Chloroflexota bacterium]|nr:hypothetical protein [Chloroflexota bacterium]